MRVNVLDGANCIGGTKLLLRTGADGLLLDFGLSFARYQLFFEEFLRPRSARGLVDLFRMGLLPRLRGCYRTDVATHPSDGEEGEELQLHGLILSHAHVDHFGMVGALRQDLPIHCTPETMAILKSSQDTGRSDYWSEAAYVVPRVPGEREGIVKSATTSSPALGRSFVATSPVPPELEEFMGTPSNPSSRSRKLIPCSVSTSDGQVGPFSYSVLPVDHSVPGCASFWVESDGLRVLYTGDLRFHGRNGNLTRAMAEVASTNPPDLLIVEGTRLGRPPGPQVTEAAVAEAAAAIVSASRGRLVVADFGGRHIERMDSFLAAAKAADRKLVVTAKDMHLLEALRSAGGTFVDPCDDDLLVYDEARATVQGWESRVLERCAKRLVSPRDIKGDPGAFVLAFSFFDLGELIDLGVAGGIYIYSSSEAYTEEQKLDFFRLGNWLNEFGFEVWGFHWEGGGPVFTEQLNASGHLSQHDLEWLIDVIRPKALLPVHTEHPEWFLDTGKRLGVRVVLPDELGEVRFS